MTEIEYQKLSAQVTEGPYPEQAEATPLTDAVREAFGDAVVRSHSFRGDETVQIAREALPDVMRALKESDPFKMQFLMDLTVVDYLGQEPRFEVVYHLYSLTKNHRLRIKVRVPEEDCRCPTLTHLWDSANWMEREAWEFYGVEFQDHPDLRVILLYPEFEGHPLRKDYPKQGEQPRVPLRDFRPWPSPKPPDVR